MLRIRYAVAAFLILGSVSPAQADSVTLNQMTSQTIAAGNSLACSSGPSATAETSYYRKFHLADFGLGPTFAVSSVTLGIETAAGGADGTQPLIIRLYDSGNLTSLPAPVAIFSTTVSNQSSMTTVTFPIAVTITSGDLVVEVLSPDGTSAGDAFRIGSNAGPQTGPSYMRAPFCGISTPTDLSVLAPTMHILLSVTGAPNTAGVGCDVQLSKPLYRNGDIFSGQLRLTNRVSVAVPVEIKVWLRVPSGQAYPLANVGADGSVILPPLLDTHGPLNVFQVTAPVPRGVYELGCRLLDPTTGLLLSAGVGSSLIQ